MRAFEFLFEVSERVKQQLIDKFTADNDSVNAQAVRQYLDKWDQLLPIIPQDQRDIQRLSFDQLKQVIDDAETRKILRGKTASVTKTPKNALYADDGLEIYKGTGREQCIGYGDGYSWCISRKQANNLFHWYRNKDESPMFYFVFDLDRPQSDEYHASVIHANQDGSYAITSAPNHKDQQATWEEIVKILPKLKPLKHLFKPEPPTDQERADAERFSEQLSDREYRELSLRDKYMYIQLYDGFEPEYDDYYDIQTRVLTDQQQTDTPDELIAVYAKLYPTDITKETYNRLKPNDQRYVVDKINREDEPAVQFRGLLGIGIKPSEEVQMAAVTRDGDAIGHIIKELNKEGIKPSERVQMAAVAQTGFAIESIIMKGIKPSERVQMAAVKQDGDVILYIINAGINPSERVQMAAVKQDGGAIQWIISAGIKPSEQVQMAAVKQDGDAIEYIVKAKIKPSERVQMAAVKQDGDAIEWIIKAKIKPSERVKAAAGHEG